MSEALPAILARLIEARKAAGLSQSQVARHLQVGPSASIISEWERGDVPLTIARLLALCDLYDVSVEWVLTGVNPYFDPQPIIEAAGRLTPDVERLLELLAMLRQSPNAEPETKGNVHA